MGGVTSFFKKPKTPAPPALPATPTVANIDNDAVTEERLRRQKAAGRQSNIVSSQKNAVEDAEFGSRVSKLLG